MIAVQVSSTLLMEVKFVKQIVLSTYRFHDDISLDNLGIMFCSSSTINMFAKTRARGEPIATPSTRMYVLLLRVKCALLVQRYSNSLISFLVYQYLFPSYHKYI